MKQQSATILLVLAGIVGVVAAFWSGSGESLGPVRMGSGEPISSGVRQVIMLCALIGSLGALALAGFRKVVGLKTSGITSLVFAVFLVPSLFQGNVLSIFSLFVLVFVGITFLLTREKPAPQA